MQYPQLIDTTLLIKRYPQLRRVTNHPAFRRALSMARQYRLVDGRARFIAGELRGGTRSHRLAVDPRRSVVVRHGTRDMEIFDEIFRAPASYEPPVPAAAALTEIAARRSLRVLDLGANVGMFAVDALTRYPDATVTSYEPEPANLQVLNRCVAENSQVRWSVVQACAGTRADTVHITAGNFADSHVSDHGIEVPAIDILPILRDFDYVKMDIEGSEWAIFSDERWPEMMGAVAVFTLEWHERAGIADCRAAAIAAVEAAGFIMEASPPGWSHGTIWGWRPSPAGGEP